MHRNMFFLYTHIRRSVLTVVYYAKSKCICVLQPKATINYLFYIHLRSLTNDIDKVFPTIFQERVNKDKCMQYETLHFTIFTYIWNYFLKCILLVLYATLVQMENVTYFIYKSYSSFYHIHTVLTLSAYL